MRLRSSTGVVASLLVCAWCAGVAQAADTISLPKLSLPTGELDVGQDQPIDLGGGNSAPVQEPTLATPRELSRPAARWLTPSLRKRVHEAGTKGLAIEDDVRRSCPGVGPTVPGVQAGTCEVVPAGCTANFIFYRGPTVSVGGVLRPAGSTPLGAPGPPFVSDGQRWFIGTAGHCLGGSRVFMQVRPPGVWVRDSDIGGIAEIGTTAKKMNSGIGKDFGAVQIYKGFLVTPALPIGGPHGIYSQCAPSPVHYYGHGYHVAVGQGKTEGGQAFWPADHYYWAGPLFGGDSGSGVMVGALAAGDLTHGLGIQDRRLPTDIPLPVGFGTRMTKILDFLGPRFYLVNADGTLSRDTSRCSGLDPLGTVGLVK